MIGGKKRRSSQREGDQGPEWGPFQFNITSTGGQRRKNTPGQSLLEGRKREKRNPNVGKEGRNVEGIGCIRGVGLNLVKTSGRFRASGSASFVKLGLETPEDHLYGIVRSAPLRRNGTLFCRAEADQGAS